MEVSCRATLQLFEASEAMGISRVELARGLDLDVAYLGDPRHRVDWGSLAALMDRLSTLLDHDPIRMRALGASMVRTPSYHFLQVVGRTLVSPQSIYDAGTRWVAPALFPHMPLRMEAMPEGRLRFRGGIGPAYAACETFFHIFEGGICELPCLLGLPAAKLESSDVTPRSIDCVIALPPPRSIIERARRSLSALGGARNALDLIDEQRRDLANGLEALRRTSDEFQNVLDKLPDLVAIHDGGTVRWVNRALVTALGYTKAGDLVGEPLLKLAHHSSESAVEAWMRAPRGEAEAVTTDLTQALLRRRDGGLVTVELSLSEPVTFEGHAARLVAGRDVTERVRLQQRLVTADRLASLGILAAGVAHEINNPLAYVLGNLELAARVPPVSPEVAAALSTAKEGVHRIRAIVEDLRALSRTGMSAMQPVDVRDVLDATLALAGSELEGRARIVREYQTVPLARANSARLAQIFLNLIVNALDAMAGQPLDERELYLRVGQDGSGDIIVRVSDTGSGISPELVEHVFDPFFTTKATGRGTGLGLAISHHLVNELGGDLAVESTSSRGTTLRVTLRAAETATEATGQPS
jgi:PAS domain S-box-containing protein